MLKVRKSPPGVSYNPRKIGSVMRIAKSPVITVAVTMPVMEAIRIMCLKGFRRLPVIDPESRKLKGIITATDIIDYLGGGEKSDIVRTTYKGNFFSAIHAPIDSIMTKKVYSLTRSVSIEDALRTMKMYDVGGLPIVDEEGRIWAIVTERDLMYSFADQIVEAKVSELMSREVVVLTEEASIKEVMRSIIENGFRRLPLMRNSIPVAIVTSMDIIRFFSSGKVLEKLKTGMTEEVLNHPALEIASRSLIMTHPDADVGEASSVMKKENLGALLVVENGELAGIITERDFFNLYKAG